MQEAPQRGRGPRSRLVVWLMLVAVTLAGCSGWEPLEVPDREYPEGSGLLSGEDGEFVIFRR